MAEGRKEDRRKARTRALLRDALMALIVEKGYDAVSIQDITDRADVARTTFYLHFKDKDELLFEGMREIYQELVENMKPFSKDYLIEQTEDAVDASDWYHAAEHAEFYKAMLGPHGSMNFLNSVRHYLAAVFRDEMLKPLLASDTVEDSTLDFVAHFMAGAEIGVMCWWLEQDARPDAKKMAYMLHVLCLFGVQKLLEMETVR